MKRLLILLGFLAIAIPGWSAIAPSAFQSCAQSTQATLTCSASMTFANNDRVVLYVGNGNTTETFSVADSCFSTWVHVTGFPFAQGTAALIDAWVIDGATAGTCTITVTRAGASTRFQWVAESYTGAISMGVVTAAGNTTNTTHSIALSTEDANDFIVAGFQAGAVKTFSASVGNLRGQVTSTSGTTIALTDNTSVTAASVTNTVTTDTNASMAKGAIELRASGSSGRAGTSSDSGGTVIISCSVDCNYTLPGIPLSTRWNVIVSAQGTHVYKVAVNSPATLNGGSSSITVPQFQAVKITTDGTNYHAQFLPIAGSVGICVTTAANGITVSRCSGDANHAKSLTAQTAAIGTAALCTTTNCGAGQYKVVAYVDSTVVCATPGPGVVSITIGWTDETGAKTQTMPLFINGTSTPATTLALGTTTGFAYGMVSFWSTGAANITYATAYTACTTGTGTYALRLATDQMQ